MISASPVSLLGRVSPQDFISFTEQDVERALALERADVLLLHDWPSGIIDPADAEDLVIPAQTEARRRSTPRTASAAAMMEMPRKRISTPNTMPRAHIEEAGNWAKMMAPSATDTRP